MNTYIIIVAEEINDKENNSELEILQYIVTQLNRRCEYLKKEVLDKRDYNNLRNQKFQENLQRRIEAKSVDAINYD